MHRLDATLLHQALAETVRRYPLPLEDTDPGRIVAVDCTGLTPGAIRTFFVKHKLSSRTPGRSLDTQVLQVLLLGLAYNIYRLRPRLDSSPLSSAFYGFQQSHISSTYCKMLWTIGVGRCSNTCWPVYCNAAQFQCRLDPDHCW